ncbi:MAG: hypothetical protein J7K23_00820 [Thermoproteales archaeon]|nr:hypothetical protein [Thermoproteales archaeon]
MKCKECGSKLILSPEGFYVCSTCGLVHEEYIPFETATHLKDNNIFSFSHIGTYISAIDDLSFSLSKTHLYYCDSSHFKHSHYMVIKEFNTICEILRVPLRIRKKALRIYYKMLKEKRRFSTKKIFHYKYLVVALVLASRDSNFELSYNVVIEVFNSRGHNVTKADLLETFALANKIGLYKKYDVRTLSEKYIKLIVSRIDTGKLSKSKIVMRAYAELDKKFSLINTKIFLGRNPHIIAIALAYIVLKSLKEPYKIKISVKKVSKIVNYSESAIRSNSLLIRKYSRKPYIRSIINHK